MTEQSTDFKPGYGGYKFGNDFFSGVDPKPDVIVSKLMKGTSVSVFGPRRIGKSSLLAETRECLRSKERNVIWVDLNQNYTLVKSISAILDAMQRGADKGIVANIKNWAEKSEFIPPDIKAMLATIISSRLDSSLENYVENYIESMYFEIGRQLEAGEPKNKPIIIFNELTTLLKYSVDMAETSEVRKVVAKLNGFLSTLRHWRESDVGIAMALSGSVSMNWLSRKYGIRIDLINDCVPVHINPMTREDTKELIELCVRSEPPKNWNDELTEEFLNILPEYYPGVVQLAYQEIIAAQKITLEILQSSLKDKIYTAFWGQFFEQFHTRFLNYGTVELVRIDKLFDAIENQKYGRVDGEDALDILSEAGQEEHELNARQLLHYLISDNFVKIEDGRICYSSGLVPAWRKMRFLSPPNSANFGEIQAKE